MRSGDEGASAGFSTALTSKDVAGTGFADHAEAVVADGLEVGAAGDEGDVVAGLEEAGADEAADAAGAHDQDIHLGFMILEGGWVLGWSRLRGRPSPHILSQEKPLHNQGLVARKTPHRFRPKTPEPASPLGEGEEPEHLAHAPCSLECWVRGRPLTGFGRRRPNLPLPSERVKSRSTSPTHLARLSVGCAEDPSPVSAEDARTCLSPRRG